MHLSPVFTQDELNDQLKDVSKNIALSRPDVVPRRWVREKLKFRQSEGLTLETSPSLSLHGRNFTLVNLFDTKF